MDVYLFFVRLTEDSKPFLSSLTACDEKQRAETLRIIKSGRTPFSVTTQKLTVDPDAGYQSCEAFQLNADGKHQVDADLRLAEQIKQL